LQPDARALVEEARRPSSVVQAPPLAAGLAILVLALAGCSDSGGEPDLPGDDAAVDGGPPAPSSQEFRFALDPALGLPVGGDLLPVGDDERIPFEVPAGHGRLTAQVAWTCDSGDLCALDVELRRGESDLMTSDFGASPLTLAIDDPQPGRWTFWAFPSGSGSVVLGLEGTLAVELS
jgi:hypothetical protein